jgi:hypothetical protein
MSVSPGPAHLAARSDGRLRITPPALVSVTAAALGALGAVLVATGTGGPLRAAVGLIAVILVPGWAVVGFLPLRSAEAAAALALAVGVALVMAAAQIMLWAGAWHPTAGVVLLLVVGVAGCTAQAPVILRRR